MHLKERLGNAQFSAPMGELPGLLSRQALLALADQAEFLAQPKAEVPVLTAPDDAAQGHILALTRSYIRLVLPTLPDFMARRSVVRYQDRLTIADFNTNNVLPGLPLQVAQTSSGSVVYRDGQEALEGWQRMGRSG